MVDSNLSSMLKTRGQFLPNLPKQIYDYQLIVCEMKNENTFMQQIANIIKQQIRNNIFLLSDEVHEIYFLWNVEEIQLLVLSEHTQCFLVVTKAFFNSKIKMKKSLQNELQKLTYHTFFYGIVFSIILQSLKILNKMN